VSSPPAPPLERFSMLETPDIHDAQYLEDRIYDCSASRTGITDGRLLAILLRDGDRTIRVCDPDGDR